jgi:hypothetical protein
MMKNMASPAKDRGTVSKEPETYAPERKAAFLLEACYTREEYESAREEVRRMGLDPDAIPHEAPAR